MKNLLLVAALLALAGCSLNRYNLSDYKKRADKEAAAADADAAECSKKGESDRASGFNDTLAVETQYNKIYDECMKAKGYERR